MHVADQRHQAEDEGACGRQALGAVIGDGEFRRCFDELGGAADVAVQVLGGQVAGFGLGLEITLCDGAIEQVPAPLDDERHAVRDIERQPGGCL